MDLSDIKPFGLRLIFVSLLDIFPNLQFGHLSEIYIQKDIRNQTVNLKSDYKYKDMVKVIHSENHHKSTISGSKYERRDYLKNQYINHKIEFLRPAVSNSSKVMSSDKTPLQHFKLLPT